jgi:hyaluronoglucosaminidase
VAGEGRVIRGVIEGFYGPPWSHGERLDLIRFCAEAGFDTWVHAPKDDPFHRVRWREPYPDAELAQLGELVSEARRTGVEFAYAIAPGLSMENTPAEFETLLSKCEQVRGIGATSVQLLWDDIEGGSAADQADISNRLAAALEQPLVICPTAYMGTEDSDYRRTLRAQLDPAIVSYWTGPEVVSHAIAREELDVAVQRFGDRDLLLWDNYPVNDFDAARLFLGPLRARDPRLFDGRCVGLIANAMVQAIPSKLALATIATFLADPHGYDPLSAFENALSRYGSEVVEALHGLGARATGVVQPLDTGALADALAPGVDAATAIALLGPFV